MALPDFSDLFGIPFARGGRGPDSYDCYGLVREMFARAGKEIPDFESPGTLEEVADIVTDGSRKFTPVPAGTPGSLVTFRVEGIGAHVGFVLDENSFLHTTQGTGVCVERLNNSGFRPIGFYDYV
ncbi:NlpC/P60 family protein [Novosphingobium sp. NPDC080210]|uniref:NlpC/P60 family protein n=1 Tax=Novosphingobium sp. NPDC080210 TaxID=3390596 RepID=UPI003CFF0437